MTEPSDDVADVASLSFEQARDELVRVVTELEQGAPTLEQSLLGAKQRLDAARSQAEAGS